MRPVARIHRLAVVLGLVALALLLVPTAATASCHIAAFEETDVSVDASAGSVTLTVFLQGRQPSCEGSIDFVTEDGSATAGTDYAETTGTVNFTEGDDREETIEVPILADGSGTFTVVMSGSSGGISPSGTAATVRIEGGSDSGDGAAADPATTTATDSTSTPADDSGPSGLLIALVILVAVGGAAAFVGLRRRA